MCLFIIVLLLMLTSCKLKQSHDRGSLAVVSAKKTVWLLSLGSVLPVIISFLPSLTADIFDLSNTGVTHNINNGCRADTASGQ